jgi:hypothetical protein
MSELIDGNAPRKRLVNVSTRAIRYPRDDLPAYRFTHAQRSAMTHSAIERDPPINSR